MGIDLGTSSLKVIVIEPQGRIVAYSSHGYEFDTPCPGFAEQDPEVWFRAMQSCLSEIFDTHIKPADISAVGLSGQMHGLVTLDKNGKPVRPAILHCDTRSSVQVEYIKSVLDTQLIMDTVMNPIYTGFLAISLVWVKENEPHNYDKIRHVMLPKDYLIYRLTGEYVTDYSDASATLAFDIKRTEWSQTIMDRLGLDAALFPVCKGSCDIAGYVCKAGCLSGLHKATPVICGGGDAVMQSVGNGLSEPGCATVNIGSSGQVLFPSLHPVPNNELSTNTFCSYSKGRWFTMGAIMSAGLALKWISKNLKDTNYTSLDNHIDRIPAGSNGIVFLPYLNGERTPHLDPDLSGAFLGLRYEHSGYHLARAVMEGVAFALFQCYQLCLDLGLAADIFIASGGGSESTVWVQMLSDVFNKPFRISTTKEQAATGAAICAGVGIGIFSGVKQACETIVKLSEKEFQPDPERNTLYMKFYELYSEAFSSNRELLDKLTLLGRL